MAKEKQRHFEELGRLIEEWRREKFKSGLALYREQKLSFSYNTYVEFERGTALPTVDQVLELADVFDQKPEAAVFIWAKVQMPSEELKALFDPKKTPRKTEQAPLTSYKKQGKGTTAPQFENTWVFGPAEHDVLLREPWFFEFCLKLALAYPKEVSFAELGLKSEKEIKEFTQKHLSPWIKLKRIHVTPQAVRIEQPHLHLPKSQEWDAIRVRNFDRALTALNARLGSDLLTTGRAYREIVTRPLTQAQAEQMVSELQRLENLLKALPYESGKKSGVDLTHSLLMVLGPRKLQILK